MSVLAKVFLQALPVDLDPGSLIDLRADLSGVELALDDLDVEQKKATEGFNDRRKKLTIERKGLLQSLRDNRVIRQVECERRLDFYANREVVIRLDTQAEIASRPLTGDERAELAQEGLFSRGVRRTATEPETPAAPAAAGTTTPADPPAGDAPPAGTEAKPEAPPAGATATAAETPAPGAKAVEPGTPPGVKKRAKADGKPEVH